jgi:N-acylneuraminate cytidylyltransferase
VRPGDLAAAGQLLENAPAGSFVFTATSFPFPIQRAIHIDSEGRSAMFHSEYFNTRSQDLVEAFHDAGQFYWARPEAWSSSRNFFDDGRPIILPRWRAQDIDTEEDWRRAELMHELLERQTNDEACFSAS